MSPSARSTRLPPWSMVAGSAIVALLAVLAPSAVGDMAILLWSVTCSVLIFRAARSNEGETRNFLMLISTIAALVTVGFVVRGVHGEIAGVESPIPSPADILHIPAYLLFLVSAWRVHVARAARRNADAWLDAGAVVLALVMILWVSFVADFVGNEELTAAARFVNGVYNVIILMAFTLFVRITATPGDRPMAYYLLGTAGFAFFIVDLAGTYSLVRGAGLWMTIALSPFVYGLIVEAVRHGSVTELLDRHEEAEMRIGPLRLGVVGLAIMSPMTILLFGDRSSASTTLVLVALSVMLTLTVVTRVLRLLQLQRDTATLERLLATEVARLAGLDSSDAILGALPDSINRLLPDGISAHVGDVTSEDATSFEIPDSLGCDPGARITLRPESATLSPGEHRVVGTLIRDAGLLADSADGIKALARQAFEAEATLRIAENERRFRSLVQHSSDVILVIGENGKVSYVSDAVVRVIGYPPESFLGKRLDWIMHKNDVEAAMKVFTTLLGGSSEQDIHEFRATHSNGSTRLFEMVLTDMRHIPEVAGVVINASDVTDKRRLERDLLDAETIDPLTLQLNRASFISELEVALRRTDVTGIPLSVAIIDLNDFKTVNDALGPVLADRALVVVAERIRRTVRLDDTVARLSGDEFGILMPDGYTSVEAVASVERVLNAIASPLTLDGHHVSLAATAGIAINSGEDALALELLRRADTALSTAKSRFTASAVLFEETMAEAVTERHELRSAFRSALANNELRLVYQPIISVTTGAIVSLEGLARWNHPTRGAISPAIFIPIAEESDLIHEVGEWALRTACQQINEWDAVGLDGFTVSINMSGYQLRDDSTVSLVADILRETGVDPGRMVIEITETVLIDDTDFTANRIRAIRELGVELAIDDFGTGYSSLSYLQRYDFDVLKIDRAFVSPLGEGDKVREREIVASIIGLASGLGATTVAEGIETHREYGVLRNLGCDRAQGFLFYRPLEVADTTAALVSTSSRSASAA